MSCVFALVLGSEGTFGGFSASVASGPPIGAVPAAVACGTTAAVAAS